MEILQLIKNMEKLHLEDKMFKSKIKISNKLLKIQIFE